MPSGAAASMSASSAPLQLEVLRRALLHELRAGQGLREVGLEGEPRAVGALGEPELGQRRPGGVDEVAQPFLGAGRRVPGHDVVAVGEEVGDPAAADHAGAGAADGADVGDVHGYGGHQALGFRLSISRASSGVATLAPIASMMVARPLDELGVGRLDPLAQVEVVLEARRARGRRAAPTARPTASASGPARRRPSGTPRGAAAPSRRAAAGSAGAPYGMSMQSW